MFCLSNQLLHIGNRKRIPTSDVGYEDFDDLRKNNANQVHRVHLFQGRLNLLPRIIGWQRTSQNLPK